MSKKQFVYIFTNFRYQGLVKVGKTKKHPEVRAEELSRRTGVIGSFTANWYVEVPDCDVGERLAHQTLSKFHFEKEFFELELEQAIEFVKQRLLEHFGVENIGIYHNKQGASIFQESNYQQIKFGFETEKWVLNNKIQLLEIENKELRERLKDILHSKKSYFFSFLENTHKECQETVEHWEKSNPTSTNNAFGYIEILGVNELVHYIIQENLPHHLEKDEDNEIVAIHVPIPVPSYEKKCVYASKFCQILKKQHIRCTYYVEEMKPN